VWEGAGRPWRTACCGILIIVFRRSVGSAFVGDNAEVVDLVGCCRLTL
jgi:hypothetical protein